MRMDGEGRVSGVQWRVVWEGEKGLKGVQGLQKWVEGW